MIKPAINTPSAIIGNALLNLMSSNAAIKAPVQPPVPGIGIATKRRSPQDLYLKTLSLFFAVFASSFVIIFSKNLNLLRKSKIFLIKRMIKRQRKMIITKRPRN